LNAESLQRAVHAVSHSQAYDSRMVPSTFLIDRKGRVTKKFVGFKDEGVLDQAFGELAGL